jgi:hypothetical protein
MLRESTTARARILSRSRTSIASLSLIAVWVVLISSAAAAVPAEPNSATAADKALTQLVAQEIATLGVRTKTAVLPSDQAFETAAAVKRGDYAAATRIASEVLAHSKLQSWQFYPFNEYMASMCSSGNDPAFLQHLNAWLQREPKSAIAYLIRAEYYERAGWVARSDDTPRVRPTVC